VAAYLNLKAGPSFGAGVLPDDAPHEARERDYFFALGWWAWGAWAGLGAVVVARRLALRLPRRLGALPRRRVGRAAGLAVAALPIALNWRAADRRHLPAAYSAGAYARALLAAAPPRAVLLVGADNDTYPLWAAQAAGVRPDVTTVTASLLPAAWYRAELARRHGLLPADAVRAWRGGPATLRALGEAAAVRGRSLAASLAAPGAAQAVIAGRWVHTGLLTERVVPAELVRRAAVPAPAGLGAPLGSALVDTAAVRANARLAASVAPGLLAATPPFHDDGVGAWARRQLACPAALLAAYGRADPGATSAARVEGACQAR
jgi:hypothetical protein